MTATTSTQPLPRPLRRTVGPYVIPVTGLAVVAAVLAWLAYNLVDTPALFFNALLIGVTNGALYGLIALGYTLVYGILELINFAHGDVFMLGGMFAVTMVTSVFGLGASPGTGALIGAIFGSLAVAMAACGAINVTVERIAYKPLRNAPRLAPLITAIGASFILSGIGLVWKGPRYVTVDGNLLPKTPVFSFGDYAFGWNKLIVLLITVPVLVGLTYLVRYTRQGKAMRAVAQDKDAAAMMGIDVNRTISFTFMIAGFLAGSAGVVYALYFGSLRYDQGFQIGLIAFTSAVLGGIGNLSGAVLGAMLIGLVQAFNEGLDWHAPGSDWTQSIVFSILILILVFRPQGLMGEKPPEGQ